MENIIINIDSRFRDTNVYPNSAFFIYKLNEVLKNCKYIRVSSFEIPNLYFTFSERKKNLSFTITINNQTTTIAIDPGMYNYEQLLTAIQDQIALINNVEITTLFTSINGFVKFESNVPFSMNFDNNDPYLHSLGYYLGFRKPSYTYQTKFIKNEAGTIIDNIYYIVSESQLDTTGDHYLFLRINDYGVIHHDFDRITNNYAISDVMKTPGRKNLLAKIIVQAQKTEHIFDNGSNLLTKTYIFKQPVNISKLEIELIEPGGFTIDLMYMDFSFTLEVGVVTNSNLNEEFTSDLFGNNSITGTAFNPSIERAFNRNIPRQINYF
jgi:hypothetical protein